MAAANAGVCLATRGDAAPPADTSAYGHLRINRVGDGGYEIATELAGPREQRNLLQSESRHHHWERSHHVGYDARKCGSSFCGMPRRGAGAGFSA